MVGPFRAQGLGPQRGVSSSDLPSCGKTPPVQPGRVHPAGRRGESIRGQDRGLWGRGLC